MKTIKYLSMAALALVGAVMTSCSSEDDLTDNNNQQPESQSKLVTLTTTVGRDGTRALAGDGTKTFAVGETMAIVYVNNSGNTVKAESAPLAVGDILDGNQSATFTFTLDDPNKEATVSYYYPAAMVKDNGDINYEALYSNQDGTLTNLGKYFDYCKHTGLSWNDGNLPSATLSNELSILAINLKDEATTTDVTNTITGMTIDVNDVHYAINREAAAGPIYVAIRPASGTNVYITATDGTYLYAKTLTSKTYQADQGYPVTWRMTKATDLSTINADYIANNGETLTGTLASNVKISIADGATVMLHNVNINGTNNDSYMWAGISCEGDANIILSGTNRVKGFHIHYPGIHIAEGNTLTIDGTGSLNASSNGQGSGIGGGYAISNGNIVIEGGTITATGGQYATGIGGDGGYITISGGTITARGGGTGAGIGTRNGGDCGDITISGGTVTAYGGKSAAGIGGGSNGSRCGDITITSGVTRVTATKGDLAPCSIGKGKDNPSQTCTCGTVTIGGVVYAGGIAESPYTYQP